MRSSASKVEDWLVAALIIGFILVNLIGLDRVPFANADEAWIAEPGLRFWESGALVSSMHAGFFGTERHFLIHAPLFTLMTGWMIWIFGFGVMQVRIVSLAMAALTAVFTYRLGRALLSPRHGLIAVLFLTWWRSGPYQWEARQSGIMLVDFARLARYDIAVPFFGMLGVLSILPWLLRAAANDDQPMPPMQAAAWTWATRVRLILGGLCAGLAIDSHPMGLIYLASMCVCCIITRARRERLTVAAARAAVPIGWILLGAGLAMLPYILFILSGWKDAVAQQQLQAERWHLGDPWFYVWNVLREWRRYISVGRGLQFGIPGAWLFVFCAAAGTVALLFGSQRRDLRYRLILATLMTGFGLLTIGEREKFFFYLAGLWPWIALVVAIGFTAALQSASRVIRIGAIALLALGCLDGVRAEALIAREATRRTPFAEITQRLAAQLPRDARVMALPTWWLGLGGHVRDYRSLTVPMFFLAPHLADPAGPTFTQRLTAVDADIVLFDQAMIDYVYGPRAKWAGPGGERNPGAEELEQFITTRSVRRVEIIDPSYGRFEIYFMRSMRR